MTDSWAYRRRPLRTVVKANIMVGRGGLLGGDTSRRIWWWILQLDCGHEIQRYVRYRELLPGERPIMGGRSNRPPADRLPPPKRARCDVCPQTPGAVTETEWCPGGGFAATPDGGCPRCSFTGKPTKYGRVREHKRRSAA